MATLGVFSWSLLQFTLVTTSMGRKEDEEDEENEDDKTNQVTEQYDAASSIVLVQNEEPNTTKYIQARFQPISSVVALE